MTSIIDVHAHPLFPDYVATLGQHSGGVTLPPWTLEQHLATMDAHDISASVLSLPNLDEVLVGREGAATASRLNRGLAGLVASNPQRLGAFASVPMDDMSLALAVATEALDELGLDGVVLSPQHEGVYLGEPRYEPLLAELDARGATVFVHPGIPFGFDVNQRLNVSALDFMFETTRMIAHMVLSGTRTRLGNLRMIATHAGGTAPYLAHRLALVSQMPWAYRGGIHMTPDEVLAAVGQFHFDLAGSSSRAQLLALTEVVGTSRLMMGFDQPMMPAQTIAPAIAGIDDFFGEDTATLTAVRHGNAAELFPRLGTHGGNGAAGR